MSLVVDIVERRGAEWSARQPGGVNAYRTMMKLCGGSSGVGDGDGGGNM